MNRTLLAKLAIVCVAASAAMLRPAFAQDDIRREVLELRTKIDQLLDEVRDGDAKSIGLSLTEADARIVRDALVKLEKRSDLETRVITPEHVDVEDLAQMLHIFDADFVPNDRTNTLLVQAPKTQIDAILEVVERLDVRAVEKAETNVELTVNLIQGSAPKPDTEPTAGDIPAHLGDVIDELSGVFAYSRYRLVDTLLLRCRNNSRASTSGLLPAGSSASNEATYAMDIDSVRVAEGDVRSVRLNELTFSATIPFATPVNPIDGQRAVRRIQQRNMGIQADLDVREGQHVVVGKASVSGDESALFVIVSAKIIDG